MLLRQHRAPEVLLVMAEGNFHTIGVRLLELALCLQGAKTHTVIPGLPAREVVALANRVQPRVVAVSVALPPQLESVRELKDLLGALPLEARPRLAVGGQAFRMGLEVPAGWGVQVCRDIRLDRLL